MGGFIALLFEDVTPDYPRLWWEDTYGRYNEILCAFLDQPITKENVLTLAQLFAKKTVCDLQMIDMKERWDDTLQHGHEFLKKIHGAAIHLGISLELGQVDVPLCFAESMGAK